MVDPLRHANETDDSKKAAHRFGLKDKFHSDASFILQAILQGTTGQSEKLGLDEHQLATWNNTTQLSKG